MSSPGSSRHKLPATASTTKCAATQVARKITGGPIGLTLYPPHQEVPDVSYEPVGSIREPVHLHDDPQPFLFFIHKLLKPVCVSGRVRWANVSTCMRECECMRAGSCVF